MEAKDLSPELMERVKAAKTPEDILRLAQEEGYDLSDEEIRMVTGGNGDLLQDARSDTKKDTTGSSWG